MKNLTSAIVVIIVLISVGVSCFYLGKKSGKIKSDQAMLKVKKECQELDSVTNAAWNLEMERVKKRQDSLERWMMNDLY